MPENKLGDVIGRCNFISSGVCREVERNGEYGIGRIMEDGVG